MTGLNLRAAHVLADAARVDEQLMVLDAEADAEESALRYEVFETLAGAEVVWRALEARGVFTPYQRFDWVAALLRARPLDKERLAIIVVHDGDRPVALLPLVVQSRFWMRTARIVGWDIGNGDWMGVDPAFARKLDRPTLDRLHGAGCHHHPYLHLGRLLDGQQG